MRGLVVVRLLQVPLQVVHAAVRREIGSAVGAAVQGRPEVGAPAPGHRPHHERARVLRLDRRRVVHRALPDLVVGQRRGVHVAVRRVPEVRLVVEGEEPRAARGRRPDAPRDVRHPAGHEVGPDLARGVVRIVAGDRRAVGMVAVARVGLTPRRESGDRALRRLLRTVLVDGESPAAHAVDRRPADERHGDDGLAAGLKRPVDEEVGGGAVGERAGVRSRLDVVEEPVARVVRDVVLPGVARRAVAAPAAHRPLEMRRPARRRRSSLHRRAARSRGGPRTDRRRPRPSRPAAGGKEGAAPERSEPGSANIDASRLHTRSGGENAPSGSRAGFPWRRSSRCPSARLV